MDIGNNDYKRLATLKTKDATEEMKYAESLSNDELLEYTRNVMNAAVDIEKNKKNPNVPNIFRSGVGTSFFVDLTKLLIKKNGFPSPTFSEKVQNSLLEIKRQYDESVEGIDTQVANEALTNPSLDVETRKRELKQIKIDKLSRDLREAIFTEFQLKMFSVLPVFEEIRKEVVNDPTDQRNYFVALFFQFGTTPLNNFKNADVSIDSIKIKLGGDNDQSLLNAVLSFSPARPEQVVKNTSAAIQPLVGLLNAPLEQRKPLTPQEILTNPAYFETKAYEKLSKACHANNLGLGESVDFIKAYYDFIKVKDMPDEVRNKALAVLRELIARDPGTGSGSIFEVQDDAPPALNISGKERENLLTIIDKVPLNVDSFMSALEGPKNTMLIMINDQHAADRLKSVPLYDDLPQSQKKIQQQQPTQQKQTFASRLGKAITALYTGGPKAAREAFRGKTSAPTISKSYKVSEEQEKVNNQLNEVFKHCFNNEQDGGIGKKLDHQEKKEWEKIGRFINKQQELEKKGKGLSPEKFNARLIEKLDRFVEMVNFDIGKALEDSTLVSEGTMPMSQERKNRNKDIGLVVGLLKQDVLSLSPLVLGIKEAKNFLDAANLIDKYKGEIKDNRGKVIDVNSIVKALTRKEGIGLESKDQLIQLHIPDPLGKAILECTDRINNLNKKVTQDPTMTKQKLESQPLLNSSSITDQSPSQIGIPVSQRESPRIDPDNIPLERLERLLAVDDEVVVPSDSNNVDYMGPPFNTFRFSQTPTVQKTQEDSPEHALTTFLNSPGKEILPGVQDKGLIDKVEDLMRKAVNAMQTGKNPFNVTVSVDEVGKNVSKLLNNLDELKDTSTPGQKPSQVVAKQKAIEGLKKELIKLTEAVVPGFIEKYENLKSLGKFKV